MCAELEIIWSKWSWSNRSTAPTFSRGTEQQNYAKPQDSWCPGRDSNIAPSEYKSKKLPLHTQLLDYIIITLLHHYIINIGIYVFRITTNSTEYSTWKAGNSC